MQYKNGAEGPRQRCVLRVVYSHVAELSTGMN